MITFEQAQETLATVKGCTFASLDTVTVPKLRGGKKNPFQGKLKKVATNHRVMLFTNTNSNAYENKVKRHLEAEGKNPESFKLGALPWGKRIADSPFIENNGKYYLQTVFLKSGNVAYYATEFIDCGNGTWFLEGEQLPSTAIQGLPETTGSEKQGLENEVIVRAFALESIAALRAMQTELT